MSRNTTPERPRQGGSHVRQPNGKLKRTEFTKPSNGPEIGDQLSPAAPGTAKPAPAPAPTEQEK
jgi:hypothetical protein